MSRNQKLYFGIRIAADVRLLGRSRESPAQCRPRMVVEDLRLAPNDQNAHNDGSGSCRHRTEVSPKDLVLPCTFVLGPVLLLLQVEANPSKRHLRQHKHGCYTRSYWVGRATTFSLSDSLNPCNCVLLVKDNLHGNRSEHIYLHRGMCVRPPQNWPLCNLSSCLLTRPGNEVDTLSRAPRGDGREQIRAFEPLAVPSSDLGVS